MTIKILNFAGEFAENKDVARKIRVNKIMPALEKKNQVILNFSGVSGATQSFMHALISDAIRKYGNGVFDLILFKDCSPVVREVVNIVAEYMQES